MEDIIKDQTPFINCLLCRKQFDTPKVLVCWHSFCLKCLEDIVPENSITLVCPSCSMPSVLPRQGVQGLPDNWLLTLTNEDKSPVLESNGDSCSNFSGSNSGVVNIGFMTRMNDSNEPLRASLFCDASKMADSGYYDWPAKNSVDGLSSSDGKERLNPSTGCSNEHEKRSLHETTSSSAPNIDDATTTTTSRSFVFSPRSFRSSPDFLNRTPCKVHPNKPLFSYCCQWELPLCRTCSLNDGHSKHKHLSLDLAVLRQKKELDTFIQTTNQILETLNLNKSFLQRTKSELDKNFSSAKVDAIQSFDCLQKFVSARFQKCIQEIDVLYEHKNNALESQLKSLDVMLVDAQKCHDLVENVLDNDKNEAVLLANKLLRDSMRNKKFSSCNINENTRPKENSFLEFDKRNVATIIDACEKLSFLVDEKQICSHSITLAKEDLNKSHLEGRQIKLSIQLVGDGQILMDNCKEKLANSLYAEVFLPNGNKIMPSVIVEQMGSKLGELQFLIKEAGVCKVEVFCFGCPVSGSPFEINISKSASSLPARNRQPLEKRKSLPAVTTRTAIPISIRNLESRLHSYKTTDAGNGRPPWNSSSHLSSLLLHRSSSSLTSKTATNRKPSSKHQSLTDLTKSLQPDLNSLKFYGSMLAVKKKIELEDKIEEEPELQNFQPPKFDLSKKDSKYSKLPRTSRPTLRQEIPLLQRTQSKAESIVIHRPICRSISLKYPHKTGQHITPRCRILGRKGSKIGEFLHVQGVVFTNETILVADSKTRFIQLISYKTGFVIKRFDYQDSLIRTSSSTPVGVVQDSKGCVYVTDFGKGCVFVFDGNGKLIKRIKHEQMVGPKGVILGDEDRLIIVDTKSCSIQTYCTQTGKLLNKFGSRGYNEEEMCGPHFCSLTLDGKRVAVSDFGNGKIKIFTLEGILIQSFGNSGSKEGCIKKPTGIATDSNTGQLVVADFELSRIQVFKENGQYIRMIDTNSSPLNGPLGLTLTDDGHVVVADSGNHCLKIFNYLKMNN